MTPPEQQKNDHPKTTHSFLRIPWWVSILLAIASYYCLKYLAPQLQFTNETLQNFATAAPGLAPIAAAVFLLIAAFRLYDKDDGGSPEEPEEQNSKE